MDKALMIPAYFYIVYIFAILMLNFFSRKRAIRAGELSPKYFKVYDGGELAYRLKVLGRHLDNQFQQPVIFLITCLALTLFQDVGPLTVTLAWAFVGFRLVHTYIHLTYNNIIHRAGVYGLCWLVIIALWSHLIFVA